jgi:hypothetical protein
MTAYFNSSSIIVGATVTGPVAVATNTYTVQFTEPKVLLWAHVVYTPSATVGNRQLLLRMLNGSDVFIMDTHAGAVFGATTVRHFLFVQGIYRETAFVDNELEVAIPKDMVFPAGYKLNLIDEANIDAAADAFSLTYSTFP